MKKRPCREKTFLDEPGAYSEYDVLIQRQRLQHRFRHALHRNRTAVLLAFVACCVALSGAAAPTFPLVRRASGGNGVDGGGATVAEWTVFLSKGLAFDLLARHFEGCVSALACMCVTAVLFTLVYPLHRLAPAAARALRRPSLAPFFAVLAAVLVSTLAWTVAVWGSGRYSWGVASGLSVGLLSACLSLKAVSFAHECLPLVATALPAATPAAVVYGGGESRTAVAARAVLPSDGKTNVNGMPSDARVVADAATPSAVAVVTGRLADEDHDSCSSSGGVYGLTGNNNTLEKRSGDALDETNNASSPSAQQENELTFGEFLFFVFAAPSLVCEPRFLKRHARRAPRVKRAASEFFYAGLTFLALHAASSALLAPTMRVTATAFSLCMRANGNEKLGEPDWVDSAGWAALGADGSGRWLFGGRENYGNSLCDSATGRLEIAVAVACALLFLCPMVQLLAFYGFWHCVCLGCAELWGYPDRHLYGPWWLVTDDARAMFRLWSTPVHRWLSSCIYRPMLNAGCPSPPGNSIVNNGQPPGTTDLFPVVGGHNGGGREQIVALNGDRTSSRGDNLGDEAANTSHSSGGDERSRTPITADNPISVSNDCHGAAKGGGGGRCSWQWHAFTLHCVFGFSSLAHEAVTFVAMRRTCWPFNTFSLIFSAAVVAAWDLMYPVRYLITVGDTASPSTAPSVFSGSGPDQGVSPTQTGVCGPQRKGDTLAGAMGGGAGAMKTTNDGGLVAGTNGNMEGKKGVLLKKVGSEWRGWGAVAFFSGASWPMMLVFNFLAWQWWRHTFLY